MWRNGYRVDISTHIGSTDIYVDVNRTDSYTEDGSFDRPYKDLSDAVTEANAGAGVANPYNIVLAPGIYNVAPFSLSSYIRMTGAGWRSTTLKTTDLTDHFITAAASTSIEHMALWGPTTANKSCIYLVESDPKPISVIEVSISRGYYGVYINPAASTGVALIQNMAFGYNANNVHHMIHVEGYGFVYFVSSTISGPSDSVDVGVYVSGANAECTIMNLYHEVDGAATVGCFVDNGGMIRALSSTFVAGYTAFQAGSGADSRIRCMGVIIHRDLGAGTGYTNDLLIENATVTTNFNGFMSRDRISDAFGSEIFANFLNHETGNEGACALGEFLVGDVGHVLPLLDYGKSAYLTGLVSGGEVTDGGGLDVDIAAGYGYINDGSEPIRVEWSADSVTLTASKTEYIYVDRDGLFQHAETQPSYSTNIILAQAVTTGADIVLITRDEIAISHSVSRIQEFFEDVIGPLTVSGCTVTASATALKLDVGSGDFTIGISEREVTGGSDVPFYYVSRDGSGGWTYTSSTEIDTDNLDTGSGPAAYPGADHWKKDAWYIIVDSGGETYYCVYGQEAFTDEAAAIAGASPSVPDILSKYALFSVTIVTHDGDAVITSVQDVRPFLGQNAPVTGIVPVDHDTLLNRNLDNNHMQYLTTGRADTWHGLLSGAHVTNGDTHDHVGGDGGQIDHDNLANRGTTSHADIDIHIGDTSNPHVVTKTQVSLGNVLDVAQIPATEKAAASGVASLDAGSLVVQNPTNATATPTADKIVIADGSALVDGWVSSGAVAGTPSLRALGTLATEACAGNDSRLSDARTPTVHAGTHVTGGGDTIANVIAAGNSGLMSGADKTKLDGIVFGSDYQTAISLARSTYTGTTTFQNKVSLVVTAGKTGTYRIGWTAVGDMGVTNANGEFQLYDITGAAIIGSVQIFRAGNSSERTKLGGFAEVLLAGLANTYSIQYRTDNSGRTVGISDARIEFWRLV